MAALALAVVLTWSVDKVMETPQELALEAENQALQEQLRLVQDQMAEFSGRLHELAETDQSLYRTLLQAEPISEDVRQVGVGGADVYEAARRFSPATADLLQSTGQQLEQLERQISLQNTSYRELGDLAENHVERLAQMPGILPTDGPIVSGYGTRRHPILRVRKMHYGVDVLVSTGTPVVAAGDGIVKTVGTSTTFGRYVEIEHREAGYVTLYAHLSEFAEGLRRGQRVKRGEQIALSGNTGRSSGPHLHYEVRDLEGRPLNPLYFFAPSMTPQQYRKLLEQASESTISLD